MNAYKSKYYFHLLIKKTKTKIHNHIEEKVYGDSPKSVKDFQFFILKFILSNLIKTEKGIYFNSKITNNGQPMILAQARVLISFCILYNKGQINYIDKYIIENLKNFLISLRDKSGLYKFNNKSWNKQDEGIATIWALLALIKTYEITNDAKLLSEIIHTSDVMHEKLVDSKNCLVHNYGENYWCLNAASKYAYFINKLLNYHYTDELFISYTTAIELCISKQTQVGYFPYSEKKQGTYLLLYNPGVIYTLENAIKNSLLNKDLIINTEIAIEKARKYLVQQMDDNKFFVEPEEKSFSKYIISNITSSCSFKE